MTNKYEQLTNAQKSVIDAKIFVRECHRRQRLKTEAFQSNRYKQYFTPEYLEAARLSFAERYLDVVRAIGSDRETEYRVQYDWFVREAKSIQTLGLLHRTTGAEVDISDLLLSLDYLPEPAFLSQIRIRRF